MRWFLLLRIYICIADKRYFNSTCQTIISIENHHAILGLLLFFYVTIAQFSSVLIYVLFSFVFDHISYFILYVNLFFII